MKKFTFALLLLALSACGSVPGADAFAGQWAGSVGERTVQLNLQSAGNELSGNATLNFDFYSHNRTLSVTGSVLDGKASLKLLNADGSVGYSMQCQRQTSSVGLDCVLSAESKVVGDPSTISTNRLLKLALY